ncbi:decarboxylase [Nonlabens sp. MB-3u-79]|jgi:alpha-acetolactate decarboxylase|uniref:decarboxylase n=1 Tax=Nonlabens sp. MB-3u-79 TaxID=2058134 RepID=UPI000C306712|nr:decarboxylase [Nonlabens sp. MB-3u-79]AUC79254.1 decarboxylase [Nonlabens sp. MB-3u-79]|tara:strand:+ start:2177 stop:2899 length:723 start_codon:yes stop_codon:yes gene_type:complete
MNKLKFLLLLIIATSIINCADQPTKDNTVKHQGALKNMMSGNLEATMSLDSLQLLPHLYALGALEDLKGEIQVFDGVSYVSKSTTNNKVEIDSSFNHKAALLVYAQIPEWNDGVALKPFSNNAALEKQIKEAALKNGLDVDQAFPFLLKGNAISLDWHVINWPEGDQVHNHKKHQETGSNGILKKKNVEIIGFYSEKHQAIYTHHTTFLHMHFKTDKERPIAGHIDQLIGVDMELYLPKN